MQKKLSIIVNDAINPAFVKANSYILEKNKSVFHSDLSNTECVTLLETLWEEEFNITIEKLNLSSNLLTEKWKSIIFPSENHFSLFMLRWG